MTLFELKEKLEKISPLGYNRVILRNIDYFKVLKLDLNFLLNPDKDIILTDELLIHIQETVEIMYGKTLVIAK